MVGFTTFALLVGKSLMLSKGWNGRRGCRKAKRRVQLKGLALILLRERRNTVFASGARIRRICSFPSPSGRSGKGSCRFSEYVPRTQTQCFVSPGAGSKPALSVEHASSPFDSHDVHSNPSRASSSFLPEARM